MESIANIIQDDFGDISEKARGYVRRSFADFLAVALAARKEASYGYILEYISETSKGDIPLPGSSQKVSAQQAALALGTLGHALDYDDISSELIGHPSTVLVPVLISLGYEKNCSGKDLIEAYIAGFETMAALAAGVAENQYKRGWHTTSTIGIFGAVACASRLVSLDSSKIMNALGIAASFASGIRANFGSMTKPLHAGWAAGNGLFAMKLADKGFNSSYAALSSPLSYLKIYGDKLSIPPYTKRYIEEGIFIKPYPSCGYSTRSIDCAIEIRNTLESEKKGVDEITSINCRISPQTNKVLQFKKPSDGMQAKFSLEYCVAQALLNGPLGLKHFSDDIVTSQPRVIELMNKITRTEIKELQEAPYESEFAEIEVMMNQGHKYKVSAHNSKGSPQNPLSKEEVELKFNTCTEDLWSLKKQKRIYNSLLTFDRLKSVTKFVDDLLTFTR